MLKVKYDSMISKIVLNVTANFTENVNDIVTKKNNELKNENHEKNPAAEYKHRGSDPPPLFRPGFG